MKARRIQALQRGCAALLCAAPLVLGNYQCVQMPDEVRVLAPVDGAALTRMPLTLEVDFASRADPESFLVLLNGIDVTGAFTLEPRSQGRVLAWADFVWGSDLVLEGPNSLEAEVVMDGLRHTTSASFTTEGDPYADAVVSTEVGSAGGFNAPYLPGVVLGPPTGSGLFGGSLGVFSLGLQGEIVLAFTDNVLVDGPGVDFTVFENPFFGTGLFEVIDVLFAEAGAVSVSQDGSTWFDFPCAMTLADGPGYPGCAGVYPVLANGESDARHPSVPTLEPPVLDFIGQTKSFVTLPAGSGGDSFDLADVGLGWARYVRIRAADHVSAPTSESNAGFDLDAVAAVNAAPATDADANGTPDAVE